MDKKNMVLLTVIAIATLIVAVIGATFAYFSIMSDDSSTSVIKASSITSGTVTLTSPNTSLKLVLNGNDMAQKLGGEASYYSVLSSSNENYLTSEENALQPVLVASVSDDNEDNEYKCVGSVKVVLNTTGSDTLSKLVEDDGEIVFGGVLSGTSKKLTEIKTDGKYELTIEDVTYTGLKSNVDKEVSAYLKINNTSSKQDYLKGETITVLISAPTFSCTQVNKEA